MKHKTTTKIGVIIVNYNSLEHLEQCIAAICAQVTPFDKIVVIDNGDNNIYSKFTWPMNSQYIQVGYNSGFAKANNIALHNMKDCQWVALINPDVYLDEDWLKCMNNARREYPQMKSFSSRLLMANDTSKVDGLGDNYHISGLAWRHAHGKRWRGAVEKEVFSACAAAAMYQYDALMEVGGFDESFFCYFEDVDLGFRLRLAGNRCLLVPTAIAHHFGYVSSGGRHSDFAIYYGHRNMVWTYVKNMPGILFWIFLPYHISLNLFSILWFLIQGKSKILLKAKFDAIKSLDKMWFKRGRVQKQRKTPISKILRIIDKRLVPKYFSK